MTAPAVQWFVLDVNPYPWKVPPFTVGRSGGKVFPKAGRDEGLHTYKEAIKEQIAQMDPVKIEGPVALHLWFWRNIPEYTTPQGRRARKHEADTTNLQKATEDALQGFLYDNDKDVAFTQSCRVEQGPDVTGMLVVCVTPWTPRPPQLPDVVKSAMDELVNRYPLSNNEFNSSTEVPF